MQEEHDHYQSMVAGPKVLGHEIQSDERQRAWLIDGQFLVRCSPLEYQVLALFFRKANSLITYTYLYHLYHVGGRQFLPLAKPTFRNLMSRMRPKLWASRLDIVSVVGIGYPFDLIRFLS